jgi:serine acetyltransferase
VSTFSVVGDDCSIVALHGTVVGDDGSEDRDDRSIIRDDVSVVGSIVSVVRLDGTVVGDHGTEGAGQDIAYTSCSTR